MSDITMIDRRKTVEKYLKGKIDFEELEEKIGEETAEAVQESEKQLRQSEELVEEISKL